MEGQAGAASAALLMLDVASAKTAAAALHAEWLAAQQEHVRTRTQLAELKQELDTGPLYALHGLRSGPSTAQQLQALHSENLQLRAQLQREAAARQQLEWQQAALLELLRGVGLTEVAAQLTRGGHSVGSSSPTRLPAAKMPAAADARQHEGAAVPLHEPSSSSSSTSTSTSGGGSSGDSASTPNLAASASRVAGAAAGSAVRTCTCPSAPSAYFPQQQQPQPQPQQEAASLQQERRLFDTWQASLQQGPHCRLLRPNAAKAMQHQHQQQQQPPSQQQGTRPADCRAASTSGGASPAAGSGAAPAVLSNSSPDSRGSTPGRSDSLDSDELAELAGVCDSLLLQQQQQGQQQHQQQHASPELAGLAAMLQQLRQPQQQAGETAAQEAGLAAMMQQQQQQHQHQRAAEQEGGPAAMMQQHLQRASEAAAQAAGLSSSASSRDSGSSAGSGSPAAPLCSLQEQLAQRMEDVKQRLSSICGAMLQEAMGGDSVGVAAAGQRARSRPSSGGDAGSGGDHDAPRQGLDTQHKAAGGSPAAGRLGGKLVRCVGGDGIAVHVRAGAGQHAPAAGGGGWARAAAPPAASVRAGGEHDASSDSSWSTLVGEDDDDARA